MKNKSPTITQNAAPPPTKPITTPVFTSSLSSSPGTLGTGVRVDDGVRDGVGLVETGPGVSEAEGMSDCDGETVAAVVRVELCEIGGVPPAVMLGDVVRVGELVGVSVRVADDVRVSDGDVLEVRLGVLVLVGVTLLDSDSVLV